MINIKRKKQRHSLFPFTPSTEDWLDWSGLIWTDALSSLQPSLPAASLLVQTPAWPARPPVKRQTSPSAPPSTVMPQTERSLGDETWCSGQSTSLSTTFMMLITSWFNHRRELRERTNSEPGATKSQMTITDASKCWCFYLYCAFFTIWNCIKMIEPRQKKNAVINFLWKFLGPELAIFGQQDKQGHSCFNVLWKHEGMNMLIRMC